MPFHNVGKASAFTNMKPRVFELDSMFIGVCKLNGKFYAYENVCAHEGGPVCEGETYPNSKFEPRFENVDRYTIACPWHGVEYDLQTGICRADKSMRIKTISVNVTGDEVIVKL